MLKQFFTELMCKWNTYILIYLNYYNINQGVMSGVGILLWQWWTNYKNNGYLLGAWKSKFYYNDIRICVCAHFDCQSSADITFKHSTSTIMCTGWSIWAILVKLHLMTRNHHRLQTRLDSLQWPYWFPEEEMYESQQQNKS